jgi:hypothetical protein
VVEVARNNWTAVIVHVIVMLTCRNVASTLAMILHSVWYTRKTVCCVFSIVACVHFLGCTARHCEQWTDSDPRCKVQHQVWRLNVKVEGHDPRCKCRVPKSRSRSRSSFKV